MTARQQQFERMLQLQHRMNSKVHPQWFKQGFEYYRALWIECGELMDHYGYKWWKKQEPDMEQVRLEIVDIWHFGLSMLIDGRPMADIANEMANSLPEPGPDDDQPGVLQATEQLAQHTLNTQEFSVPCFWRLMRAAKMSDNDLYRAYVGKNVLNFFRQDNGYKQGSYEKIWFGREDNEHLAELSHTLDASSEHYEQELYAALLQRYPKTAIDA